MFEFDRNQAASAVLDQRLDIL